MFSVSTLRVLSHLCCLVQTFGTFQFDPNLKDRYETSHGPWSEPNSWTLVSPKEVVQTKLNHSPIYAQCEALFWKVWTFTSVTGNYGIRTRHLVWQCYFGPTGKNTWKYGNFPSDFWENERERIQEDRRTVPSEDKETAAAVFSMMVHNSASMNYNTLLLFWVSVALTCRIASSKVVRWGIS